MESPKPLVNLDGRPMIKRLIDIFLACHAEEISIIVNEEMAEVRAYLESLELPVPLHLTVKSTPSSMHSLYEVTKPWRGGECKFIATTVDTIFRQADFEAYASDYQLAKAGGMMAVTPYIDDEKPLYVATDSDMRITAFCDAMQPGIKYVSAGIYGLSEAAFPVLDRCLAAGVSHMRNFQRALLQDGILLHAYDLGKVIDVDHAGDIEKARALISTF
ncbi:MAG: NTP transferase domain-containing protein [Lachnospiraceae bacterium]|nr:NTP transferase domain-containing protein [Lachnospiraceae bacterium]